MVKKLTPDTEQFATLEAGYVLVRLLQEFSDIKPSDDQPFTETLTLTLASGSGTWVSLTPRDADSSISEGAPREKGPVHRRSRHER